MSMLLFLDFDGVLHPAGSAAKEQFVRLPRLETVLRAHAGLQVALTTDWQADYPLDALRAKFSQDIAARIIGGVSNTKRPGAPTRHDRIQVFLRKNIWPRDAWVALDDLEDEFPARCPRLVLCRPEVGFDEVAEGKLRGRLLGRI